MATAVAISLAPFQLALRSGLSLRQAITSNAPMRVLSVRGVREPRTSHRGSTRRSYPGVLRTVCSCAVRSAFPQYPALFSSEAASCVSFTLKRESISSTVGTPLGRFSRITLKSSSPEPGGK